MCTSVDTQTTNAADAAEQRLTMTDTQGSKLAQALACANKSIRNPAMDATNPHFHSRFASLASCLQAVRGPLADNGLSISQELRQDQGVVSLTTHLIHESGESRSSVIHYPLPEGATIQVLGGIATYLRRYTLCGMLSIVGDADADAEDCTDRSQPPPKPSPPKPKDPPKPKPATTIAPMDHDNARDPAVPPDKYPYEWEGDVEVVRYQSRMGGAPHAMQINGPYGTAWVAIIEEDDKKILSTAAGLTIKRLGLIRIGGILRLSASITADQIVDKF